MLLSLDTETALIAQGLQAPPLACVATCASGEAPMLWHHSEASELVESILRSDAKIVGHNIAFDMAVLAAHDYGLLPLIVEAYEADRITDTMLRQKLIDIAKGEAKYYETEEGSKKAEYSLDALAWRFFRKRLDKNTWRLRFGDLRNLALSQWPEGAKQYVLEDAAVALDLYELQEREAYYLVDQYRQARAAFWIQLWRCWGIMTTEEGVRRLEKETIAARERIAADLRAAGLLRPDRRKRDGTIVPGSRDTKAAKARMLKAYAALGKEPPRTDTGDVSLNKVACEESGDPILMQYAELTSLGTVLSKDIPMLLAGTRGPIHPEVNTILETGRTSTKNPNTQNVRRLPGIRECFVPRPGYVFVSADYGGLELCTLAQVCKTILGYSTLAEALNRGHDPHLAVAASILRVDYETAKAMRKGDGPEKARVENARQTGKVANFGFPGGLGAATFVHYAKNNYGITITEAEARELKRQWLATWPEMRDYLRYVGSLTDRPFPQIQQLFSGRVRGGVSYTEACNSFFQGLGSDIAKSAGWLIMRGCYLETESPLFGCRIVNFVHDEFILEAPEHRAHEAAIELARRMVEGARPWLPDVKITAEPQLMRVWSKNAKPVFNEQGRLIPWEPKDLVA